MTSDLTWLVLLERRGGREGKEGGGGKEGEGEKGRRGRERVEEGRREEG